MTTEPTNTATTGRTVSAHRPPQNSEHRRGRGQPETQGSSKSQQIWTPTETQVFIK
ncbi:hypothetical protein L195_g009198, partial [Trifolium pratense]